MNEDGGNLKLLLPGCTYPCASADGDFILCRESGVSVIYYLNSLILYRSFPTASPYTHSWSPDGVKIAATDGPGTTKVYDVSSGNQVWSSGGGGKRGHYFSNNSKYIIETVTTTLNEYIPAVDVIPEKTRTMPLGFIGLTISPDGKYIAAENVGNVYIMRESDITDYWLVHAGIEPAWSPDNKTLVINNGGNIATCDIYGGNYKELTSSGIDSSPCFSFKPK